MRVTSCSNLSTWAWLVAWRSAACIQKHSHFNNTAIYWGCGAAQPVYNTATLTILHARFELKITISQNVSHVYFYKNKTNLLCSQYKKCKNDQKKKKNICLHLRLKALVNCAMVPPLF